MLRHKGIKASLKILLFLISTFPFGYLQAQDNAPMDILFISIDDLNDWVGPLNGHPQTLTPNIDRLAARGMTFLNAHSPSALCNAVRTALLSGIRPSTSGIYGNAPDWRTVELFQDKSTLPALYRENGFATLGAGKIFHAHTYAESGLYGFNDTRAWDAFYPGLDRQLPTEVSPLNTPANENPLNFMGFDWSPIVTDDQATGDGQVVNWVSQQLRAETGSPRFVAAGIYRPHLPWYLPQKYFDMHPLEEIIVPEVPANDLDDIPDITTRLNNTMNINDWVMASGNWKQAVQAYLASISFADAMVGQLLDALEDSGRAERTIIVLWSDHGFHLGEKNRWRKMSLWERSTHVPFIIVAPGVTTPGSSTNQTVSTMDIYATLTELSGIEAPTYIESRSLLPLLENPAMAWRFPAVSTFGYMNHSVRSERYRYIRYSDGSEELYDHASDPNEWNNLAGNAEYQDVINDLANWLPEVNTPDLLQ